MYNEFDQNITKESDPVSADTIHIDIVIRTFHPVSISAFFIRNNGEITECILLCMFLYKDGKKLQRDWNAGQSN